MKKYQVKVKLKEGIKDIEAETLMTFVDASDGIRSIKTGSIYYIEQQNDVRLILDRKPTKAELAVYDAMWSEHCSYKSSKPLLKHLYTKNKHVIHGPGENAGVIDIGDGDKIAFKVESHNHPSYIEPFHV